MFSLKHDSHLDTAPGKDCEILVCAPGWSGGAANLVTSASIPPVLLSRGEQANIPGFCLITRLTRVNLDGPGAKASAALSGCTYWISCALNAKCHHADMEYDAGE